MNGSIVLGESRPDTTYDFKLCKYCGITSGIPRYHLKNQTTLYVCSRCGFHYIDYLDNLDQFQEPSPSHLQDNEGLFRYIDNVLHYSHERFSSKVTILAQTMYLQ